MDKWEIRILTVKVMERGKLQVRKKIEGGKYHGNGARDHHGVQVVKLEARLQERNVCKDVLKHGHEQEAAPKKQWEASGRARERVSEELRSRCHQQC